MILLISSYYLSINHLNNRKNKISMKNKTNASEDIKKITKINFRKKIDKEMKKVCFNKKSWRKK